MPTRILRIVFLVFVLLLAALTLQAQTGLITGTVSDKSGAVIPGAKVTALNAAIGASRSVETGGSGSYSLPNLLVGNYDLTIEATGFTSAKFAQVQLTVAQTLTINAVLEPGVVTQTIEVTGGDVALLETENAQISAIVDQRRIVDLPLLTRNPYDLILLSPGTIQSNSSLGGFSVNGARERNNNFLLDGVDNNDTSVPGIPGGLASLNPDATQEFRVITNNFLPEYGRNNGAIIDIVTKAGTNSFQGNAYWFGRYNALAARDFFNTTPNPQDPFVRNQFGWSFGGPIKKDKTFFFVNNEYQRFRTTVTNTSVVPTAAFKSGIFDYNGYHVDLAHPDSPTNAQGLPLDPVMQKVLALLPNPNGESVDDVRGIYRFPSPSKLNAANITFRADHRFNDKHSLFLRYTYNGSSDPNPYHDEIAPGLAEISSEGQVHGISANLSSALRPTLLNEFRFGVNRADYPFACNGRPFDSARPVDDFGAGSDYNLAGIVGIGCQQLGDSNGQTRRTGTWTIADNFTWVKNTHTFKFGAEVRRVFENGYNAFVTRPTYSFNAFETFGVPIINFDPANPCDPSTGAGCEDSGIQNLASGLLGLSDTVQQYQYFNKDGTRVANDDRKFRYHEYGFFAQDSWKLTSNFTLNLGLRYQYNAVPYEVDNNLSTLFANPAGTAPFTFEIVGPGEPRQLFSADKRNFEPRIGFSWDPTKKGKLAIRGGYGIFHDRVFGNLVSNASTNPPFQVSVFDLPGDQISNLGFPATQTPSATVDEGAYATGTVYDPSLKMPLSQNWNFGVQYELPAATTLEVNYVGSHGSRIFRVLDGNPPQPNLVQGWIDQGVAPALLQFTSLYAGYVSINNTALYQPALTESIGNSTYNGLQVKVTKRLTHGLSYGLAYTWSHSIDDASDPLVAAAGNRSFPRNSLNLHEERGQSDFDIRHRLVLNYIYEFPFGKGKSMLNKGVAATVLGGWQVNGISSFQSGHPYDVFGNRDSEHTGLSARGDVIGSTTIPAGADRTQTGPPVTSFALAPFGRGGNLGRNIMIGPKFINTDLSLLKDITFTERFKLELRVECFNVLNRPQFSQPGNAIADPDTFGISTSTILREDVTTSARQIQLGLKLNF